jgi:hypothetical protein
MAFKRGFLLAEEEALLAKLSNIRVADPKSNEGTRRIKVYYRMPPAEEDRIYPFITIDLVAMDFAADRAHSAQIYPVDFWPSEYADFQGYADANSLDYDHSAGDVAEAVEFHPYDLFFSVTTHTRNPIHDRQITSLLLGTAYLPDRWGYLHVPADDSIRHLERVGWANLDEYEGNPQASDRVFRKAYNVKVSAFVAPEYPYTFQQVLEVAGSIHGISSDEVLATWSSNDE